MTKIKLITENIIDDITDAMSMASAIYIMTSFVMESGVRKIESDLKQAAQRGAEIRFLTGDYLFVTQPEGLRRLIQIDPNIEVRLWKSDGKSFHPKAYMFQFDQKDGLLIVGSSNLSRAALTYGTEWNLAMDAAVDPAVFQYALDQFMKNFQHNQTVPVNTETLKEYEKEYEDHHRKNPDLVRFWTEQEATEVMFQSTDTRSQNSDATQVIEPPAIYQPEITPRPAQQEALQELEKTLEEGYDKAMIVMATGLGKTYLAGFFAKKFSRILFIAHREEILYQAKKSFENIMPERSHGIYNGNVKEGDADCVFASIFTLGMKHHRERFSHDHFDLIIIDEFHHAAASSYQKVLDHFQPEFLLGITATPDRLDGKDVYAICDGNVAYQLHFIEAIQRGWLAPFHYYGVYDDTDYTQIRWLGTRYDEEQLLAAQLRKEMAEKIFNAWQKHRQTRTLAFCSSIRQADFLSDYFKQQGIRSVSLHSRTMEMNRSEAIQRLEEGALDVIFTVDLFNEGVDIPSVDTLLFVRPTESLTVFTQQVGRGLRLHEEKEHCTIIDLIGNYRHADVKLQLFDTRSPDEKGKRGQVAVMPEVPENCVIDLDTHAIQLLEELARKKQPRKEKLRHAYFELKQELGYRPTYLELHLHGKADSKEYRQKFKSYPGFLYWAEELDEEEIRAFKSYEPWFVEVERTAMTKSYKMIVLLYMLNRGPDHWLERVSPDEVAPFFHQYLTEKEYRKRIDFSDRSSRKLWDYDRDKVSRLVATMPMTKWSGSSGGLITFEDDVFRIHLDVALEDRKYVYDWTKQICEYRLHTYFERKEERMK
ncbi:MAG: DEAD/DEAH box helicase family protein [Bacillaceae bacterium]|nr:DEAD/DEAH box helicase family protein [Bacillaceae bacterium]